MNERKSKDANGFYRKGPHPCDLGGHPVGFTSITETDTAWRNLFHPWAYGLETHAISSDILHVLIFIFLGKLGSLLIKSQPFVAMEPNQTWSLLL